MRIAYGVVWGLLLLAGAPLSAETIDETLVRVRAKYPATVTAVQSAAILNETAYLHRGEGWALLGKPGGTNCPQPTTAIPISCDYLLHQVSGVWFGWDALVATGKPGAPGVAKPNTPIGQGSDMTEVIKNGARAVVQAVDPGGQPPEPPEPPICDACAEISALQATVSRLTTTIEALTAKLAQLEGHVAALESATPPRLPVVTCAEIQASTGRAWGHAHPVIVWKCEVQ